MNDATRVDTPPSGSWAEVSDVRSGDPGVSNGGVGGQKVRDLSVCVLEICDEPADAGKWCRAHWDELFARDVAIAMDEHSDESAARTIVTLRRQLDFLGDHTHATYTFCACGHMVVVHSHGGCHGLSRTGGWDEWGPDYRPCKCLKFEARA